MKKKEASAAEKPEPKKRGRPKGVPEPHETTYNKQLRQIVELRYGRNLPVETIAHTMRVSEKTVRRRLDPLRKFFDTIKKELQVVHDYMPRKSEVFSAAEIKILNSCLKDDKISGASLRELTALFKQLHASGRLEQNKSTANIATIQAKSIDLNEIKGQNAR